MNYEKSMRRNVGPLRGSDQLPVRRFAAEIGLCESQTLIATPVNTQYLNLPLPFAGED